MKPAEILYCGDCRMSDAARYLGGAMLHHGYRFEHIESDDKIGKTKDLSQYRLFILSDYPSKRWTKRQLEIVRRHVEEGASLWMIGGWGSFKGVDGDYHRSPLAEVLPVKISPRDDRNQGAVGYRLFKTPSEDALKMDFESAPVIAGFNRVTVKKEARLWLQIQTLCAKKGRQLGVLRQDPLLVSGTFGKGRTLAYMSDLAPHWSGGLVDWGTKRVEINITGKIGIQVSDQYLLFIAKMMEMLLPDLKRSMKRPGI